MLLEGRTLARPVVVVLAFVLQWQAAGVSHARSLVIYYANETVPEALESRNYRALLAILDGIQGPAGLAAADSLRSDAQTFRAKVLKDIVSLEKVSLSEATDLTVFTNTLALQSKYLVVRSGAEEMRPWTVAKNIHDPVTEYSPLSSKINFGAAIYEALEHYGDSDDIILIVNSHGTKEFAVIPRVAADFTRVNIEVVRKQLQGQQGDDLAIRAVELQGIRKTDLWHQLDSANRSSKVHFSLVFLQACESAASSWMEYFSVPPTVTYVAHTGFTSISPQQFDYSALGGLERPLGEGRPVQRITAFLRQTGAVYFDTRFSYWRWPLLVTAASLPKWFFFFPSALWLFITWLKMSRTAKAWLGR